MKNKKPKKEEAKKEKKSSSRRKWVILLIAIAAVALFIAPSYFNFNGEQTSEETNLISEQQPNKTVQQKPENEEFTSGIIIIEVTPTATPEVTPVSKDRPIMLSLKAPKNVSVGDAFTVDILVDPRGNNISIAQFKLVVDGGVRVGSFQFGPAVDSKDSDYEVSDGGEISLMLAPPAGETLPTTEFLAGTVIFTAIFPVKATITFHQIDIVDSQLNNIYTVGEPATTIFIG